MYYAVEILQIRSFYSREWKRLKPTFGKKIDAQFLAQYWSAVKGREVRIIQVTEKVLDDPNNA